MPPAEHATTATTSDALKKMEQLVTLNETLMQSNN